MDGILIPIAGVVAALGVALLLATGATPLRVLGAVLAGAGGVPLVLSRTSQAHTLLDRPVLLGVGVVAGVVALAVLTLVFMRYPWLVPPIALVIGLRIPLRNPPSPTDHLVPLYLVLAAGVIALLLRSLRGDSPPNRLGYVGYALAVYVVIAAASLAWTADREATAYAVAAFTLPLGLLAALTGTLSPLPPLTKVLPWLLIVVAVILAGVAFWQWHAHEVFWNDKLMRTNAYGGFFRTNSLLFDPSLFGRVEALALVTIAGLLALAPPRRSLILAALAAVPIFLGLATSYSQSSLLALSIGVLVIACVVWRWKAVIAIGAIVAIVAIGALATPQGRHLLHEPAQKASSARLGLVQRSINLFEAHPIEGSGLGAFAAATDKRKAAPHNVLAGTAAELGIIGALALLAFLWSVLHAIRHRRPDADRPTHIILAALFATILAHALFYDNFFADPAMWVIAAMLAAAAGAFPLAPEPISGDWIARRPA
ncbi:MAG: O-antigen ligase family protein [Gaiellales bacterium]